MLVKLRTKASVKSSQLLMLRGLRLLSQVHAVAVAVSIANSNKRVAVKYVPLMLQGTARTWLNSLKPYSINSWLDFTEAFVRNFTSTYKRAPKPRQLSLCVQGPAESTRDYLTRWAELRNSCEGVHEVQAIE